MKKIPIKRYKYTNEYDGKIKKVHIIKETEHSVFFVGGGRCKKECSDTVYRDTPEEVFEWYKEMLKERMEDKKEAYLYYKEKYDNFIKKGMVCK